MIIRRQISTGYVLHILYDIYGNRLAEYLYDPQTQTSGLIAEYIWRDGTLVGAVVSNVLYFVYTDHIGRVAFATDANDAFVYQASYLPFGKIESAAGGPFDLRFPGQWFQSEKGLFQNWMRDYDPEMGRYMQPDPLGLVDGAALYNYARQSPMMYTDPRGEHIWVVPWIWGIITGGTTLSGGVGASATGVAIGAGILAIAPNSMGDGTSNGEGGAQSAASEGGTCQEDDSCESRRNQCYMRKIADRPGSVWGESRCQQCYRQCKRDGVWPQTVEGTRNSCKYWRSPYGKFDSLLPRGR